MDKTEAPSPADRGSGSNDLLGLAPERAAFEVWASREWAPSDLEDKCSAGAPRAGEYRHQGLQDAWEVWQAAAAPLRFENERLRQVWEDTRTQRDDLLAHIAGKSPLPQWAADWIKA